VSSRETAYLAGKRGIKYGSFKESAQDLRLLDAGHILGSRGLLIDEEIFFTGDFVGRSRAFLNRAVATKCETLIMDTTFGKDACIFPSIEGVIDEVNKIIADFFSRGIPVVLMGYALGKAQILSYYFSHWDPIYTTKSIIEMNEAHSVFGVRIGEHFKELDAAVNLGLLARRPWILIAPMSSGNGRLVRSLKERYGAVTIAFSGWAIEPRYASSRSVDFAFPLSDHCDFNELVDFVRECDPKKVYTTNGFAVEFARHLRKIGFDASPVGRVQKDLWDYSE
jgi:putative mRNA 3-end processing factor